MTQVDDALQSTKSGARNGCFSIKRSSRRRAPAEQRSSWRGGGEEIRGDAHAEERRGPRVEAGPVRSAQQSLQIRQHEHAGVGAAGELRSVEGARLVLQELDQRLE